MTNFNLSPFENIAYPIEINQGCEIDNINMFLPVDKSYRAALLGWPGAGKTKAIINYILPNITKDLTRGLSVVTGLKSGWVYTNTNPNVNIIQTETYAELDGVLKRLKSDKHNILFITGSPIWYPENKTPDQKYEMLANMWSMILELYPSNIILDEFLYFYPTRLGALSARFNDFNGALYVTLISDCAVGKVVQVPTTIALDSFEALVLVDNKSVFSCSLAQSI